MHNVKVCDLSPNQISYIHTYNEPFAIAVKIKSKDNF